MKSQVPEVLEKGRVIYGPWRSTAEDGFNGQFAIEGPYAVHMFMQISNGLGWEHVSLQIVPPEGQKQRDPKWDEMCFIKDLVWDAEEWVIQYHPAQSVYVNCHPHVLHLWKPIGIDFPKPPSYLVGPK